MNNNCVSTNVCMHVHMQFVPHHQSYIFELSTIYIYSYVHICAMISNNNNATNQLVKSQQWKFERLNAVDSDLVISRVANLYCLNLWCLEIFAYI